MLKKWDDIARLEAAIMQSHGCCAIWHKTVRVHEVSRGQPVWRGKVEIFNLKGHPKAKRCYGWSQRSGKNDEDVRLVIVLEIPPVDSALTAVRVSIVAGGKKQRNEGRK